MLWGCGAVGQAYGHGRTPLQEGVEASHRRKVMRSGALEHAFCSLSFIACWQPRETCLYRLSRALGAVERLGYGRIPSQEGVKAAIKERSGGVAFWSMLAAAVASCMLEATTTQLDNIFLPLHHYAMLLA